MKSAASRQGGSAGGMMPSLRGAAAGPRLVEIPKLDAVRENARAVHASHPEKDASPSCAVDLPPVTLTSVSLPFPQPEAVASHAAWTQWLDDYSSGFSSLVDTLGDPRGLIRPRAAWGMLERGRL